MWKFKKEDGTLLDAAYIDGYSFGDRLMEGVIFKVTINSDNTFNVEPIDGWDGCYLMQFNKDYWSEAAVEYASGNDVFYERPNACCGDVTVYDVDSGIDYPNC